MKDAELLAAIRPWMTLDSEPADHQRLDDRLEAWSCFSHRQLQFVVRLTSAAAYDRRAAYFAHGRAWPLGGDEGVDAGLHLGRTEVFESPWRNDSAGERVAEAAPALVRPQQIAGEQQVAANFAGHLHQALASSYPLVIAAPVADFRSGSSLHALVAFSRAVLPPELRRRCRVRIFTRLPDLFLRHLQANLVVVPEETAADALAAHRDAALIDRLGVSRAGRPLDAATLAYAQAVVERASHLPEGVSSFTRRFARFLRGSGLPTASDARAVQLTYNLAYALGGPAEQSADLLRNYLPKAAQRLGPGIEWERLIDAAEWARFPAPALIDLALLDPLRLTPGVRELQQAVEGALGRLRLTVEEGLKDWWNPAEAWKVRRLVELLAHEPPLLSTAAAVERAAGLSLRDILAADAAAVHVLDAELRQGRLAERSEEAVELGQLAAADAKVFELLKRAVATGQLDTAWARALIDRLTVDSAASVVANFLLRVADFWEGWGDLPTRLLERLRQLPAALPGVDASILEAGRELDPARHLDVYLLMLDLMSRLDQGQPSPATNLLVARLAAALPEIDDLGARDRVVAAALMGEPSCLQPTFLVAGGSLRAPWLAAMADRLLAEEPVA
ncbi:MAG TPA: hypothetical protein VFS60_13515, partial [Thermoanaerobaculia bacterium]|nr:hypothetical protein [Thermoanaerobaculia bacterium]